VTTPKLRSDTEIAAALNLLRPHTENPSKWERGKPAQINAAQ
jgi:hypothetical protein